MHSLSFLFWKLAVGEDPFPEPPEKINTQKCQQAVSVNSGQAQTANGDNRRRNNEGGSCQAERKSGTEIYKKQRKRDTEDKPFQSVPDFKNAENLPGVRVVGWNKYQIVVQEKTSCQYGKAEKLSGLLGQKERAKGITLSPESC